MHWGVKHEVGYLGACIIVIDLTSKMASKAPRYICGVHTLVGLGFTRSPSSTMDQIPRHHEARAGRFGSIVDESTHTRAHFYP